VAVDPTYIHPDDPAVQAVVRAHRRALQVIHNEPDTTVRHIQTFLGRHTADEARAHYETFIAPYFTTDGQADLAVGATAITAVAAELGVPATVTAAEFYRTATTTPQEARCYVSCHEGQGSGCYLHKLYSHSSLVEERSKGVCQQYWSQVEQEGLAARWSHACCMGIIACAS
jgi:hypothetical protein